MKAFWNWLTSHETSLRLGAIMAAILGAVVIGFIGWVILRSPIPLEERYQRVCVGGNVYYHHSATDYAESFILALDQDAKPIRCTEPTGQAVLTPEKQ